MKFVTATPDSKDSTAIYCLELFDREEVLQLSGEWTEELRYRSQAEELGRFSGKRWRLPWKWEVSSSTWFQNISNMHRTDASLTDLDTVVYKCIYIVLQSMQIIHIIYNINIYTVYIIIHNYIWYMYMIVCKCSFSIPSDHWQDQSSIGATLAFLRVTGKDARACCNPVLEPGQGSYGFAGRFWDILYRWNASFMRVWTFLLRNGTAEFPLYILYRCHAVLTAYHSKIARRQWFFVTNLQE